MWYAFFVNPGSFALKNTRIQSSLLYMASRFFLIYITKTKRYLKWIIQSSINFFWTEWFWTEWSFFGNEQSGFERVKNDDVTFVLGFKLGWSCNVCSTDCHETQTGEYGQILFHTRGVSSQYCVCRFPQQELMIERKWNELNERERVRASCLLLGDSAPVDPKVPPFGTI